MEEFTPAEIKAISEFRSRIADVLHDDFSRKDENLIRWLRARDLNLDKAEELFRNALKWREENKVDKMMECEVDPEMTAQFPYYVDGFDREGGLVLSLSMGSWDMRKCVEDNGPEPLTQYFTRMLETGLRKTIELNEKSTSNKPRRVRYTYVSDMEGFSFRQMANMKTVNSILQAVSTMEARYPEVIHKAIVINAPTVFSTLFALIKPLLAARTLSKVKIYNSNKDQWGPALNEIIDPSELREAFGGTKI